MKKTSDSQLRANKKYREKVQNDEGKKWQRNKMNTLRSARNHIRNYSDISTLQELKELINIREEELKNKPNLD